MKNLKELMESLFSKDEEGKLSLSEDASNIFTEMLKVTGENENEIKLAKEDIETLKASTEDIATLKESNEALKLENEKLTQTLGELNTSIEEIKLELNKPSKKPEVVKPEVKEGNREHFSLQELINKNRK